ncbi:IS1077B transposase [Lactococcus cremoris subsp. cremoris NZ9000]|nr:IS1077B transposase [Lactococcus cremoris subsp. cremoris NZ9000]
MLKIRQEHANAGYRPMSELLKQRGYITSTTRRYSALNEEARASCDVLLAQIT